MHFRRRLLLLSLPFLSQGCKDSSRDAALPFIGRWQPAAYSIACMEGIVEFRSNGLFTTRSGAQILTAQYEAQKQGSGYLLTVGAIRTNGQPNCQGLSAQFVADNYVSEMYIEATGDTAWAHAGPDAPSVTLIRLATADSATDP